MNHLSHRSRHLRPLGYAAAISAFALSASLANAQCCGEAANLAVVGDRPLDLSSLRFYEAQANTFTRSLQDRACLDVDSAGNVLIAWDSRRQELGSYGVVGQFLDPLGRPLGTEFRINQYAPGLQHEAAVAFDKQGCAWVAWQSDGQDGDEGGIYLRGFAPKDGSYAPMGDEILVNSTTKGAQTDPSLAINAAGQICIVWSSAAESRDAVATARLFDVSGQPISDEMVIGSSADGHDRLATTKALSDGRFVIAWDHVSATGEPVGLFARTLAATDEAPLGVVRHLTVDYTNSTHIEPSLAVDSHDNLIMAWMRLPQDATGYDIVAQRFDADLQPVDSLQTISTFVGPWQSGAAVTVAADDSFIVAYNVFGDVPAWTPEIEPITPSTVMARTVSADGQRVSDPFTINQGSEGQHTLAAASNSQRLAFSSLGTIAIAWNGQAGTDDSGIGLTVAAPPSLDLPAPPAVEALAAGQDLVATDLTAPPIRTENWKPQERELFPATAGPDFGFQAFTTTEWQPPDPDLAVGPNHVIAVVNMRIMVLDKAGNQISEQYLEDFWGDLGANYFVFDPVAQYDHYAGRYVVVAAEHEGGNSSQSRLDVAVSKTSDPTDGWHKYRFTLNSIGSFVDFENLSIGKDAYFICADYFGGGGNVIHIFNKTPMLSGNPVTMTYVRTVNGQISLCGTDDFDTNAPAHYFATTYSGSSTRVRIYGLRNALTNPTLSQFDLAVPSFSNPPSVPQRGSSNRLATVDYRIKHGVYRAGSLYLGHATGEDNTARVRWYQVAMNGWPTSGQNPTLTQSGNLNPGTGQHSWFQDIGVDAEGDMVICANRSSVNDYPFVSRFVRKAGDPNGTFRAESRLVESNGAHTGGRWGDYAGVDEDPAEPGVFWSHHEYNEGTGTNWRTWVGRVDSDQSLVLEAPTVLRRGNLETFTTRAALPGGRVYVVYSTRGLGSTFVPALNATLSLARPTLAGSSIADAAGTAVLSMVIPNGAPSNISVWIQSAENRNTSNVIRATIN